jgi:hypothetical protein
MAKAELKYHAGLFEIVVSVTTARGGALRIPKNRAARPRRIVANERQMQLLDLRELSKMAWQLSGLAIIC